MNAAAGYIEGITQSDGKFISVVESVGVYQESSTYESTGYLITSAADFFTAESKQFVGAEISTFSLPNNTSVELFYSTKFEALDDPNDGSFIKALDQAAGTGDTENKLQRYLGTL